jgi:hypothetical protein
MNYPVGQAVRLVSERFLNPFSEAQSGQTTRANISAASFPDLIAIQYNGLLFLAVEGHA